MSSAPTTPPFTDTKSAQDIHLLVLIHGMWGNPKHLGELARIIRETHPSAADAPIRLEVLIAESNRDESTYDGIDWGGERVAQEVLDHVDTLHKTGSTVTKLSVTGYSLGGLLARYVVGILHQRKFFATVQPVSFTTFATPHLGLPRYENFMNKIFRNLGPKLLSRTGGQFYAVDKWSPRGRPLLQVLADPEQIFYKALALFPRITVFANAVNDITVPYVTAAIETHDPFVDHVAAGLEVTFLEGYTPILKSYSVPDTPPLKEKKPVGARIKHALLAPNPGPPFLQFRFPGNMAMYVILPLLMPFLFSLAYTRLALASRKSRSRIALLEAEPASAGGRLIHVVAEMERSLESAVLDMVDDAPVRAAPGPGTPDTEASADLKAPPAPRKGAPILSSTQREMAAHLNALPQLEKKIAFIHPWRNSHAIIVARDPENYAWHREGWGVIRCWADAFEV